MKAIVWTKYGSADGLQLREVEKPSPRENEVLIEVHAAAVTAADTEFRRLKLPLLFALPLRLYLGVIKPTRRTILGTDFAGVVELAGKDVTRYQPGDQVFGYTGLNMGTYAEYMCLPEKLSAMAGVWAKKPANLTYEQAAAVHLNLVSFSSEHLTIKLSGVAVRARGARLTRFYSGLEPRTGVAQPRPLQRMLGRLSLKILLSI